ALFAPRFLPEGVDKFKHPHNWLLEAWAAGGLGVALALAVAFGAFFWHVGRWWSNLARRGRQPPEGKSPGADAPGSPGGMAPPGAVRWEYYIGGSLGLLLGFVLRVGALPPEDVLGEAVGAGLRAVVWFAAFALYERVRWTDAERVGALAAGVAALLLHLTLQG